MKNRATLLTIFAIILLPTICSASTVIIDFEGIAPNTQLGGINADVDYVFNGYQIGLIGDAAFWNDTSYYVENNVYPDSGSDWLATNSISIQSNQTFEPDRQFDVISADISGSPFLSSTSILNYRILTSEYTFIDGVIDLDGLFGFERILFSDDFKNINYVKFYTNEEGFGIDNIALSNPPTAVPLPSALILFLSSFAFLPVIRRFKKS